MSKTTTLIVIFVLVFLVIGVVIYMVMASNKKANAITEQKTTTQTGVGNLLSNANPGTLGSLIPLIGLFK